MRHSISLNGLFLDTSLSIQRAANLLIWALGRNGPPMNDHILIAEDDALFAEDLRNRLESLNYSVCGHTASAKEAVNLARSLKPDLVLMDIQLPGEIDGIEAAYQIRALGLPLVFVTGYWDGPTLQRAKLTGPCGYILKPFETADLAIGIEIGLHNHHAHAECVRHRNDERVREAVANVNTLSGLLPICAYCKKIKEETGDWTGVEFYIMKRTKASFTHGMCPECFERVKQQLDALQKGDANSPSLVLG
jgi:CheY-like chemotaxis protein